MKNKIEHTLHFAQKATEVWEYLTRPELMELWLMKNDFAPKVGHQFQFRAGPVPDLQFDGNIYCTVMEIVPGKKLVYSWKLGPGDGRITVDSLVTWTLVETAGGTDLHIAHTGFRETDFFALVDAMDKGWWQNINKIAKLLNERTHGTTNA